MRVLDLFVAPINSKEKVRQKRDEIELIENYGIKDDKFAGDRLNQVVLIVPKIAYDILKESGIILQYGSLGENILVDFNIMEFNTSTILKIGETTLEITQKCTLCSHLAYFDKQVPKLVKNHRGVYCKIIKGGKISKKMSIEILQNEENL